MYYAPQQFAKQDTVRTTALLPGRETLLPIGATGVVTRLDSQKTMIQFPGHLLNCLEIDIPYIRKVPKPSAWLIQGLAPSSTPPHKLIALAPPNTGTRPHKTPHYNPKNSTSKA